MNLRYTFVMGFEAAWVCCGEPAAGVNVVCVSQYASAVHVGWTLTLYAIVASAHCRVLATGLILSLLLPCTSLLL
jgi:hypothetical protein